MKVKLSVIRFMFDMFLTVSFSFYIGFQKDTWVYQGTPKLVTQYMYRYVSVRMHNLSRFILLPFSFKIIPWYVSIISIIALQLLLVNANFDYNRRNSSTRPRYWIFFRHIWFPRGCTDICNNCRKYWKVHDSKLNFLLLNNHLSENDCV